MLIKFDCATCGASFKNDEKPGARQTEIEERCPNCQWPVKAAVVPAAVQGDLELLPVVAAEEAA